VCGLKITLEQGTDLDELFSELLVVNSNEKTFYNRDDFADMGIV
jgi:hypothetical protein